MQDSVQTTKATSGSRKPANGKLKRVQHPVVTEGNAGFSASSHSHDTRTDMIAKAAYQLAEQRGFAPGHELDDWLAAEFEVNQRLMGNGFM
jgi:Protein of unknown function (DUF2934)